MRTRRYNKSSIPTSSRIPRGILVGINEICTAVFKASRLSKQITKTARRSIGGFTLMEVVVTLGILALFVGMLGLLPQLMNLSAQSANETRAAQIAAQVFRDLVPTLDSLPALGGETEGGEEMPEGSPQLGVPYVRIYDRIDSVGGEVNNVNLTTPSENSTYYDENGKAVGEDEAAQFHATVKISPDVERSGFCQVEVQVRLISASVAADPYRFVTKIAFPRKEESP